MTEEMGSPRLARSELQGFLTWTGSDLGALVTEDDVTPAQVAPKQATVVHGPAPLPQPFRQILECKQ